MLNFELRTNIDEYLRGLRAKQAQMEQAMRRGVRQSRPQTDAVLASETRQAFKVRDQRMMRTWRLSAPPGDAKLIIRNLMRGFALHARGGTIMPRHGRALLIPINTRLSTRIGTKKFYKMIDWLRREKLTFIKGNILYVKPPMNTSRRGGVGVGTRAQKSFRSKFQGSKRRPSGFEIGLNDQGLTPIAVLLRSITMRKRFDMDRIVRTRLVPIVLNNIGAEMKRIA